MATNAKKPVTQVLGKQMQRLAKFFFLVSTWASGSAVAQTRPDQVPLFLTASAPPAILLNMGRDHKLYYEAYNDASDVDGDGQIDVGYKPAKIVYYGLFDSFKCYDYTGGIFVPVSTTSNKQCSNKWSGDFLNYLTTTRIDAIRRVMYGGKRSSDSPTDTVLERAFIPQDAHSFGKEYRNPNVGTAAAPAYDPVKVNGYDISNYAPTAYKPANGKSTFFASVTLLNTADPLLRVLINRNADLTAAGVEPSRIWNWVSIERPVAGSDVLEVKNGVSSRVNVNSNITNLNVRVRVCVIGLLEQDCRGYPESAPTVYKPTGVLHEFGDKGQMRFGLMSGSYDKNFSGGVLRKNISNFADEIVATTGQFTTAAPIVRTLDAFKVVDFGGNYEYACGWYTAGPSETATGSNICANWGNPVAEMMYEGLRYLAGKTSPTSQYVASNPTKDDGLSLPRPTWKDPYVENNLPYCSKPVQMVIADIYPSFDGDEIPGSAFGGIAEDLGGAGGKTFNASSVSNQVSAGEGLNGKKLFVGQSGSVYDGQATGKDVAGFGNIRGIAPEEPTRNGTYYAAAVAHYGKTTDLRPSMKNVQNVDTYAIALASPLPRIQIPVPGDKTVTIIPAGVTINGSSSTYKPTNQIVDFYVDYLVNQPGFPTNNAINAGRPAGRFLINFEDVEQGADHDMDAIVEYTYELTAAGKVKVSLRSTYAAGGFVQHMGYVISGTSADGTYYVVRDFDTCNTTWGDNQAGCGTADQSYSGDKPGQSGKVGLPITDSREFTPGATAAAAFIPKDPLWYAAKWGGYPDERVNTDNQASYPGRDLNDIILLPEGTVLPAGLPTLNKRKWDTQKTGEPDNYFLVSDAALLRTQLRRAFIDIQQRNGASAGIATGSTGLTSDSWSYVARFDSTDWSGEVVGAPISVEGVIGAPVWTTNSTLKFEGTANPNGWADRRVLTWSPGPGGGASGSANLFSANAGVMPVGQQDKLVKSNSLYSTLSLIPSLNWNSLTAAGKQQKALEILVNYIKGDKAYERAKGGTLRDRDRLMGDVINSNVAITGPFDYGFSQLPGAEGTSYKAWLASKKSNADFRTVFVGANDGMLHAFDAATGSERFAFIPNGVYEKLYGLLETGKPHEYFVDGKLAVSDAYRAGAWTSVVVGSTGAGGRSVFALDVGAPTGSAANVLWEFVSPDLGYPLGKPVIVRTPGENGKWVALVTNGYFSTNAKAKLFVLDLFSGAQITSFEFGSAVPGTNNGLGAPGVHVRKGVVQAIFAGDLRGSLWGVNTFDSTISNWTKIGGGNPVMVANAPNGTPQPITAAPSVSEFVGGGLQVFFGTGKLFVQADRADNQRQSLYGLQIRRPSAWGGNVGRSNLVNVPLVEDGNKRYLDRVAFTGAQDGWYFDLPAPAAGSGAERFVAEAKYSIGYVDANTWMPLQDACAVGGESWRMTASALNGFVTQAQIDINDDGYVDGWEGKNAKNVFPAGKKLASGTISSGAVNLTPGDPNASSQSNIIAGSADCKPGEVSVAIDGRSDIKGCRPENSAKRCPANHKVVSNSSTSTGTITRECVPLASPRQSWNQLEIQK